MPHKKPLRVDPVPTFQGLSAHELLNMFGVFSFDIFIFRQNSSLKTYQVSLQSLLCIYFAAMFQAVRALMIVGIVLGILGLLVCIFALKCIRIGSMEDSAKANMTLTSGIMFIIAGEWMVSCLSRARHYGCLELTPLKVFVPFLS